MQEKDSKNLKAGFVDMMQAKILSGELKPGDRLPPERELALQVGISRGSVNQGILDLERMGFLRIVPRKGTFVAEYMRSATPETLAAIMSYNSAFIDPALFRDLMELRILVERECARLSCANLTQDALRRLQDCTDAIYAAPDEMLAEAVYCYHKCITEISGNAAYAMVFQSFEKMIRNLIREHYSDRDELKKSLPKFELLTAAIARRDAFEADRYILSILSQASDYLNEHLRSGNGGGENQVSS